MEKLERVGVFEGAVLAGEIHKPAHQLTDEDVLIGDLPADGAYKRISGQFIPVSHGHGKPAALEVSRDRALYLLINALINDKPIPQECKDWAQWFEKWGR